MIIFRTFKTDNKVISYAKKHKRNDCYSAFLKDGTISMEKLRIKTAKIILNAIENKLFSEKEIKKIMIANPEILLSVSSEDIAGYDFEETFKVVTDNKTGKQSATLPVPEPVADKNPT